MQFKQTIIQNHSIKKRLIALLLQKIENERNGEMVDTMYLQKAVSMLIEVGLHNMRLYEQEFEQQLLQQTRDYYRNESNKEITSNSCHAFLLKANARFQEECERIETYLHPSSRDKLVSVFLHEYIEIHSSALLDMPNSGLVQMIVEEKFDKIKLMYSLFKKSPNALNVLKECLKKYIVGEGEKLVRNNEISNDELIKKLIEFRQRMIELLAKSLEKDQTVDLTIKVSFEKFINENSKTAQALVAYLDSNFKSDFKNNTEVEISEKVDKCIQIFRYLQNKDEFEGFYKASFSKRLLDSRKILEDAEQLLIRKLKEECGFLFTNKVETMYRDIKSSEQRMQDFKKSSASHSVHIDLNVKVLTTGHWPNDSRDMAGAQEQAFHQMEVISIPREIKNCMDVYKQYYMSKFSGRQLHWRMHLGFAEIRARIGQNGTKRYELSVSTYQMCILMLFNDNPRLTYHDLLQKIQISEQDMKSHLIPLCQFKILAKNPQGKDFKMEDFYQVNFQFHNNSVKVKVPIVHSKKAAAEEANEIQERVDDDRKHMIEAVIVKIMKTRKRLSH